ncbi:MAG: hypothetical protein ACRC33_17250 [Gemmataceae bacterium]
MSDFGGGVAVPAVNRERLFYSLRESLCLLAADADVALAGVPDGCCKPDELALDFYNYRAAVVGNFAAELPPAFVAALADVNAAFGRIAGDGWSDEAVRSAAEWAAVREQAGVALRLMDGFTDGEEHPAKDRAINGSGGQAQ